MKNKKILFGICGSFCNHAAVFEQLKRICIDNDVQVIVTENVYTMDTRFHSAKQFLNELENVTKHEVWHTLVEAEKVGPIYHFDLMVVAPMTSTVLSKFKNGMYDNSVVLAMKAHLRNNGKVVIGVASNDVLSISGNNLFSVLNFKNVYSLPFYQDNPFLKANSIISEWTLLEETMEYAFMSKQIQPLLIERRIE